MKILVLGKNGQVGSDLIHLLKNRKIEYVGLDRNNINLTEIESIKNSLARYEFDVLVNCAAYTKVDLAETEVELATKINALAVGEMAKACRERSAKLVHISTDYVFAGDKSSPYLETDKTDPQSVYGMSKLQGEDLALNLNDKTWVLRTAWVYGESGSNFPKTIAGLLKQGKELNAVDDQKGAPTWSRNIAEAILDLVKTKPNYGIFNCTNQGETTWFEFAQEIAKTLNIEVNKIKPEKSSNINRRATRPSYSVLSNSKWIEAGLHPLPNWKDAWQEAQSSVFKNL